MEGLRLPPGWEAWQLTEELGRGSYGTVYKAQRQLGEGILESAIKVIRIPREGADARAALMEMGSLDAARAYYKGLVEDCVREIRVMNGLKGITNIVSVEDDAQVENPDSLGWTIFVRMELLTSFREYQQNNTLTEDDIRRLGKDICTALEFCEEEKILHRDIKPENILVSPRGSFKLGDFGVARKLDQGGSLYSMKGTYAYMAPELVKGESYDHRADLYSLGLVLYRLLNRGREPFLAPEKQIPTPQEREKAAARRLSGEALPAPQDASPGMAKVILKACAYQPKDRYPKAAAFRQALESTAPGKLAEQYNPKRRKKPLWAAFLVFLALGSLLLFTSPGQQLVGKLSSAVQQTNRPIQTIALSLDAVGITFLKDEARHWVNQEKILSALVEAGCTLTPEEESTFRAGLKQQFAFEGKARGLLPGDSVTLVYHPQDSFVSFLNQKGYALQFEQKTRDFPGT